MFFLGYDKTNGRLKQLEILRRNNSSRTKVYQGVPRSVKILGVAIPSVLWLFVGEKLDELCF